MSVALGAPHETCRPDGMSDAEANRIIELATTQGQTFRSNINELRASGLNYERDKTYDELIADPDRALELANERHLGRESSLYTYSPEHIREMGASVDGFVESHIQYWVQKKNVNFFANELTNHLADLAVELGGKPTKSKYRYQVDAKDFVYALGIFAEAAQLKHITGSVTGGDKFVFLRYRFAEEWTLKSALEERKPNFLISVFLTTSPSGEEVTFDGISFGPTDLLKNHWPMFETKEESCLATYPLKE